MKPAIVLKAQFITPNAQSRKDYSSYIDYIHREDALKEAEDTPRFFSKYIDYMNDRKKGAFGFDDKRDKLEQKELLNKSKLFDEGKEDKRILWQDVYSFDNSFLEDQGLYNSKTKEVDAKTLTNAVRASMDKFKQSKNINHLVWTGAIHRNTDNIHIHVASVNMDPDVEREKDGVQRGYRSDKVLNDMKSKFINRLVDRDQRLDIMTKQRDRLVKTDFLEKPSEIQKGQLEEIKSRLPKNKNKWSYNRKAVKDLQPLIDEYTHGYIKKRHGKQYEEYHQMLDQETEMNKRLYGTGTKEYKKYKDTKSNKLNELDERMGNSLLKHLKAEETFKREMKQNEFYKKKEALQKSQQKPPVKCRRVRHNPVINRRTQFMIERGFNTRYKDQSLDMDNKRLEQKVEQEKARQQYGHEL
ncbi:MobP2 family relaxase [Salinicoccus albus]|uniref:MobP2 family relaxase n=1 Tax=Salinicoccus albus TaxID=418756 RepID=UPI00037B5699|nr:MobP2 family relaxase [Salinicoccus albus]